MLTMTLKPGPKHNTDPKLNPNPTYPTDHTPKYLGTKVTALL